MKDQEATTIVEALRNVGFIDRAIFWLFISDQCPSVDGSYKGLLAKYGIQKLDSSDYHPEGDGETERIIQVNNACISNACVVYLRK